MILIKPQTFGSTEFHALDMLAGHGKDLTRVQLSLFIYPQKWDEIRLEIGNANDWQCKRCGLDLLYPGLPAPKEESYKRRANVHHKDRNRRNNHFSNLELLCPKCHLNEHRRDRLIAPGQLSLPFLG